MHSVSKQYRDAIDIRDRDRDREPDRKEEKDQTQTQTVRKTRSVKHVPRHHRSHSDGSVELRIDS